MSTDPSLSLKVYDRPPMPDVYSAMSSVVSTTAIHSITVGGRDKRSLFSQLQPSLFPWWIPIPFQKTRDSSSMEARVYDSFCTYQAKTGLTPLFAVMSRKLIGGMVHSMQYSGSGSLMVKTEVDGSLVYQFCGASLIPCRVLSESVIILYAVYEDAPSAVRFFDGLNNLPYDHQTPIPMQRAERYVRGGSAHSTIGVPFALYN